MMLPLPALSRSLAETQDEVDDEEQDLIDHDEKQAGDRHHQQHHAGGDQRLLAGGPGHLRGFGADFLNELERISHRGAL